MSYQINKDCNLCELYRDAKSVCIGGRGPEPAALLVVGQNPGYKEDRLGEPFVGESGTLLNRLLRDIEVTVRVTNAVKCYTPDNRKPSLTEQEACRVYLEKEISTCAPEAILALGNEALTSLTGQGGITKKRGKPLELRASIRASLGLATSPKVIATWHPAFILRDPSHLVEMEEDFAAVIRYIRSLRGEEQGETVVWKELASRKELHDLFETSSLIGYDIETNGAPLNSDELKVHMVGLSNGETTLVARSDLDYITTYMTKHSDKIVGYNSISFDDVAVSKVNRLAGIESGDAMYLDYLLDAGTSSYDGRMKGRHKLQSSVIRHLQIPPWKDEVVWSWAEFDSFKRDLWPIAALYNGRDCSYTVQLYRLLWPKLSHKQKLLITYLMNPAGRFLASIEKRGVPISLKNLQEVKLEVEVAKEKALDALVRHAFNFDMWTFNPNSHPQVRDLLFNKMKLVPSKYTTGGEPSTDEESIKSLLLSVDAKDAEVLASLLSYRGSTKLLGTYIENCVPEADGRIHTGYSLTQTTTGRTASYGWSTQRTPRDKRLRKNCCRTRRIQTAFLRPQPN